MGPVEKIIVDKLAGEFNAEFLQVTNESYMHSVPAGSESHFKVILVTEQFVGKRQVQRHQAIYGLLAAELQDSIHALALHTFTISEWAETNGTAPQSPDCLGGSKVS